MMKLALGALVTWTCACGSAAPHTSLSNRAGGRAAETLAVALTRDVGAGAAVAIVPGEHGLRAISADGQRQRLLTPTAVTWAVVDHRANVIWFGDDKEIDAIDLDALDAPAGDPPRVEPIVTDLPSTKDVTFYAPVAHGVMYPSTDPGMPEGEAMMTGTQFSTVRMSAVSAQIDLVIGPTPSINVSPGIDGNADWVAKVQAAPMPGRAFLASLAGRADHDTASPARPAETRVDGVDRAACTQSPDACGTAEPIAGTKYWLVEVALACDVSCSLTKRLYDSVAKKFLDTAWAESMIDAWVAPDGSAFVSNGVVTRFDRGPLAETPEPQHGGGGGGGWLGGGLQY